MRQRHIRMDESERQAEIRYQRELADSKIRHARYAARRFAATLMLQSGNNLLLQVGGRPIIRQKIAMYAVHPALLDFATGECLKILHAKGRA